MARFVAIRDQARRARRLTWLAENVATDERVVIFRPRSRERDGRGSIDDFAAAARLCAEHAVAVVVARRQLRGVEVDGLAQTRVACRDEHRVLPGYARRASTVIATDIRRMLRSSLAVNGDHVRRGRRSARA